MPDRIIRQATHFGAPAVQRVSSEAYTPSYLSVIGAVPKPALEDYSPRIRRGEVWMLEVAAEMIREKRDGLELGSRTAGNDDGHSVFSRLAAVSDC